MKIITQAIQKAFEKQGDTSQKSSSEIQIICKLFNPCGAATWWLYEDEGDGYYMAFSLLDNPMDAELGRIYLPEMLAYKNRLGIGIERDTSVEPFALNLKETIDKIKGR